MIFSTHRNVARHQRSWSLFCLAIIILLGSSLFAPVFATTAFENQLSRIHSLHKEKKHAALITQLQTLGHGGTLEDIRLFLLAESLRQIGREAEAVTQFEQILKQFPDTIGGRKAMFSYLLVAPKVKGPAALPLLEKLARSLPTAYQKGKALESLIELHPSGSRERSLMALEALRAYRSKSGFYQEMPESQGLLQRILAEYAHWRLTRDEWIEVLLCANREKMGTRVVQILASLSSALGSSPQTAIAILSADALRQTGQTERAAHILASLQHTPIPDPSLLAFSRQIRGDLLHFMERHEAAVTEYAAAMAFGKPPVDVTAVTYRLMRSAFEAGNDPRSLEAAKNLGEQGLNIPLMPIHLYEMGLKRYDAGNFKNAVPFFLAMQKYFPGHYRADDALGYSALAVGPETAEGKKLIAALIARYPHSFFVYWLDPNGRQKPLPMVSSAGVLPETARRRVQAWKRLLVSPFDVWAREEIRQLMDENPTDAGLFKGLSELYQTAGDYNQTAAVGERFLKNILDSGRSSAAMPSWAWQTHYPRPFWSKVTTEAQRYSIDPYWILSIMREESHFNPKTLSRSNAMGLMQILPSTGKWIAEKLGIKGKFSKDSLWDISRNISFGAWYLAYLKDLFKGDLFLAAAAYNGGQGNILRKVEQGPFAGLPVLLRLDRVPMQETRDYYKKVMGSWWNYHRLYGAK
jgi:soluble lytic murein transglycosylase